MKTKEEIFKEIGTPLSRVINEGVYNNSGGFCPNCHSTTIRKPLLFGKDYCINKDCRYNKEPINNN